MVIYFTEDPTAEFFAQFTEEPMSVGGSVMASGLQTEGLLPEWVAKAFKDYPYIQNIIINTNHMGGCSWSRRIKLND
jgi:hypothetical protein